jgi:hypothetical protein
MIFKLREMDYPVLSNTIQLQSEALLNCLNTMTPSIDYFGFVHIYHCELRSLAAMS